MTRNTSDRVCAQVRIQAIDEQLVKPTDGRSPITDPTTISAIHATPRGAFIPSVPANEVWADRPHSIGFGQTISQPYVVGLITQFVAATHPQRVLEIGAGCGYQAGVLSHIAQSVFTIEIIQPLAESAHKNLKELHYNNVHTRCGDGHEGWPTEAPFQAIVLSCAAPEIPKNLWSQLAIGGRLIAPIRHADGHQQLMIYDKGPDNEPKSMTSIRVRFVPLNSK